MKTYKLNLHGIYGHRFLEGIYKNSKLLLGTMYQSNKYLSPSAWLEQVESLLGKVPASWDRILVLTLI